MNPAQSSSLPNDQPSFADPLAAPWLEGSPVFSVHGLRRQSLPIVVTSPHSGRVYPTSMTQLSALSPQQLALSEDALVDQLIAPLADQGAVLLQQNIARAYVDVNREANELDSGLFEGLNKCTDHWQSPRVVAKLGVIPSIVTQDLPIYAGKLPAGEAEERLTAVFHPFHAALAALVESTVQRFGGCMIIDCHSMPALTQGNTQSRHGAQPDIVVGTRFGNSCAPWLSSNLVTHLEHQAFSVAMNRPFAGGAITQKYALNAGHAQDRQKIQSMQIEVSRSLYLRQLLQTPVANEPLANKPVANETDGQDALRMPNQRFSAVSQALVHAIVAIGQRFAGDLLDQDTPVNIAAQ